MTTEQKILAGDGGVDAGGGGAQKDCNSGSAEAYDG